MPFRRPGIQTLAKSRKLVHPLFLLSIAVRIPKPEDRYVSASIRRSPARSWLTLTLADWSECHGHTSLGRGGGATNLALRATDGTPARSGACCHRVPSAALSARDRQGCRPAIPSPAPCPPRHSRCLAGRG